MVYTYEPTTHRRRRWGPLAAVGAALVIVGGTVATVLLATSSTEDKPPKPSGDISSLFGATSPLADASTTCSAGTLGDKDRTLVIDMAGEDPGSGTATIDDVLCVLGELEAPQSVVAQMESTRALDGMQSATWSTFKATWTYHPDDGLDVILTASA